MITKSFFNLLPDAPALQDLMKEVVQGRKLETENAHHWRQTKHLLRYVKAQEREIGKTERYTHHICSGYFFSSTLYICISS